MKYLIFLLILSRGRCQKQERELNSSNRRNAYTQTNTEGSDSKDAETSSPSLPSSTEYPSYSKSRAPSKKESNRPSFPPSDFKSKSASGEMTFYAMGDIPYNRKERELLVTQLDELYSENFVIHLGDIFHDKSCPDYRYKETKDILLKSTLPVFIVPGDNEWKDCVNENLGWSRWMTHYRKFHYNWDLNGLSVTNHVDNSNFAFVMQNTLFLGLNLVSRKTTNNIVDQRIFEMTFSWAMKSLEEHKQEAKAVVIFGHTKLRSYAKKYFFKPLYKYIDRGSYSGIPFLYIHGDGHKWEWVKLTDNMIEVQVDRGGRAPPVKVTVHHDVEKVDDAFSFDRRGGLY